MSSIHIVCPHCASVNRIDDDRLLHAPKCGHCKQALFTSQPLALNSGNFLQHISRNDIPVVVDFWAPWCGPCKMMAPAYSQAAAELEPLTRLAKLNTEEEQTIGANYAIRSIPTLIIFKGGREIARQSGAMNTGDIVRWVKTKV